MKKIVLVGKPNSGKSLLFNQLTGLRQKVANFPGVTVELKRGNFEGHEIIDFPGTYSLEPISKDESVAISQLHKTLREEDCLVLCNLDATRLERSLVFAMQVQALAKQYNRQAVYCLNLIDEAARLGHQYDVEGLSEELGNPVYAVSAKTLIGVSEFRVELKQVLMSKFSVDGDEQPNNQSLEHNAQSSNVDLTASQDINVKARFLAKKYGIGHDLVLKTQNKIDNILLNSVLGGLVFLSVMFLLFQSIFTWAAPLMDGIEAVIIYSGEQVSSWLPYEWLAALVNDAIFGGFGAFLVFVPQIVILTMIISVLEESGYLARTALICHKPLSLFGLSGRSFIPYLSAHACAIPGIYAARTIESPRKRLVTMLTVPLMSCSARIPVYSLLIAILVPDTSIMGGMVNLQGFVFFCLYFGGFVCALFFSVCLNKWLAKRDEVSDMPFVLELPPYRLPNARQVLMNSMNTGVRFVKSAGPIIFMVSFAIWVLAYFPNNGELNSSFLASIGTWIEPVFSPMGLDWRYAMAILLSFLAREVFVGVLATIFAVQFNGEDYLGLATQIQSEGLSLASGIALLAFYVIALQCVATVATLKGETKSNLYSWGLYIAYGFIAYLVAICTYTLLSFL